MKNEIIHSKLKTAFRPNPTQPKRSTCFGLKILKNATFYLVHISIEVRNLQIILKFPKLLNVHCVGYTLLINIKKLNNKPSHKFKNFKDNPIKIKYLSWVGLKNKRTHFKFVFKINWSVKYWNIFNAHCDLCINPHEIWKI